MEAEVLQASRSQGGDMLLPEIRVNGPDSFDTHDWIVKKAIKAAGRDASWVRIRVALRATDDPDAKGRHRPCLRHPGGMSRIPS